MKPPIPKTDSIEELARFWDTHDLADYLEELPQVPSPFRRDNTVNVPLSNDEHDALRRLADREGVDEGTLIHEWVREKLHLP